MITFPALLELTGISRIDFLKIDIEGSEFMILPDLPFEKIAYVSMEVHQGMGDVAALIQTFRNNGFDVITATSDLIITSDHTRTEYLYAKRKSA